MVEDNEDIAHPYVRALQGADFSVSRVEHAQAAIDCIDQATTVDLVVLDLFLPEHNGLAVLQHLQSYEDWQQLPVIVLSSYPRDALKMTDVDLEQYGVRVFCDKSTTTPQQLRSTARELLK